MGPGPPFRTVLIHEHVTGGGLAGEVRPASLVAEGRAMRRAAAEEFSALGDVRVVFTLDAREAEEPGPWEAVRVGPGEAGDVLARRAAEADHTLLIAPETGGVLEGLSRVVEAAGGRSLGSTPAAIRRAGSKTYTNLMWGHKGVAVPPWLLVHPGARLPRRIGAREWPHEGRPCPNPWLADPGDEAAAFDPYPAVLKPNDGAGSVATALVLDAEDGVPADLADQFVLLFQSIVPGPAMSASFLVDDAGRAFLVGFSRMRTEVRDGRFLYLGGEVPAPPPELGREASGLLGGIAGLRGWVGVDFVVEAGTGRPMFLEINPRLTTSFAGFRRLLPPGSLAWAWLDLSDGDDDAAASLAGRVGGCPPLIFAADGTILSGEAGTSPEAGTRT